MVSKIQKKIHRKMLRLLIIEKKYKKLFIFVL